METAMVTITAIPMAVPTVVPMMRLQLAKGVAEGAVMPPAVVKIPSLLSNQEQPGLVPD